MAINSFSTQYKLMSQKWKLPLALWSGTEGMRAGREEFLPRQPSEHLDVYNARLNRSFLFNVFRRTIQSMVGNAFSNNIALSGVPNELKYLEYNANGKGQSITEYASELFQDILIFGKAHTYTDFPSVQIEGPISVVEYNKMGLEPYFARISPVNLIGWKTIFNNGFESVEHIRIADSEIQIDDNFEEIERELIRLVTPESIQVYGRDFSKLTGKGAGDFVLVSETPNALGYVPLTTAYAGKIDTFVADPPLADLAWLNLQHYQTSSDQSNILHVARVPFLLGTGFSNDEADELTISANNMILSDNKEANVKWIEHTGASINAGRQHQLDVENQMKSSGAELVFSKSVARQTATSRKMDFQESLSIAQVALRSLEQSLEKAYETAGNWKDLSKDFNITVNIGADLNLAEDPNPVQGFISLAEFFGLDPEIALEEGKRRGLLAKHLTVDDITMMEKQVEETLEKPLFENEPENQPNDSEESK